MSETSDLIYNDCNAVEIIPSLVNMMNAECLWGDMNKLSYESRLMCMMFDHWSEVFLELDGCPDILNELRSEFKCTDNESKSCDKILNKIRRLSGGKKKLFEHYMTYDQMKCNHQDIAELFKRITEGTFIRKKTKTDSKGNQKTLIYKYDDTSQLWDNTADLKCYFISVMNAYMDRLCQTSEKILNKKAFEENYNEKDKDEKDIYFKRQASYRSFVKCNSHINAIIDIFKSILPQEDTLFDLSPEYDKIISFKNGIYNLDTNQFRRRDITDRFTEALEWDYSKTYNNIFFDDINQFFTKLQPDPEQRTFTISFLKYCLRGGNPQALYKMNIGYTARNGKTTEMNIFESAFPMYTEKLHRSIFNVGCPKFHKYAHKLVTRPIRLAYINELDESKLDEEILKDFSDDSSLLNVEEMYGTMCENQRIQCKLITTSNKDPNLKLDGGLMARIKIQKYESRFVQTSEVDESKHWYLVDPTWVTSRFSQDAYKLAFFHFLLSHGNVPVMTPEANVSLVKEQLDENDDFLPKLQQYFVITKDPSHKVSHLELQRYFSDMPVRVLNGHLKRLGIEYDKNGMTNSIRKVYRGIRKYTQAELCEIEGDENPE